MNVAGDGEMKVKGMPEGMLVNSTMDVSVKRTCSS